MDKNPLPFEGEGQDGGEIPRVRHRFQLRNSYQDLQNLRIFKMEIPNPANPIILIQTMLRDCTRHGAARGILLAA